MPRSVCGGGMGLLNMWFSQFSGKDSLESVRKLLRFKGTSNWAPYLLQEVGKGKELEDISSPHTVYCNTVCISPALRVPSELLV